MTTLDLLRSIGGILAVMALVTALETLLPFVRNPDARRRHRAPNLALVVLTLSLNFAFQAGAVLISAWLGARGIGLLAGAALSPLALLLLGIFVLDASTWACHRLMHRFPALWRVHRVHHSDPLVDVTTTFRQHPIEGLWRFLFIMAPAWALGVPAEAVATYRVLSALVGLGEHMNVKLWEPLDRALSWLTCTPNMHKLHHSRLPIETDSNYGNLFSLFDRVFGTFTPPSPARAVAYGLAGLDDAGSQRLGALLQLPLRR
ncbi:MAG TPA: sterol desaturase family protein [Myxococcota bacterium]|jgi:sterol desaturase/sphingolipid hydroxylase (fatty acid hydroxylase superfamily)